MLYSIVPSNPHLCRLDCLSHLRSIYGPHICGDSIDLHDGQIITGSWRMKEQLQLWDMGSGELIETVRFRSATSLDN